MSTFGVLQSSTQLELKRYVRSSALLLAALATPIAAHYMVPDKEASYAVLTINQQVPVLTAAILGLDLGVIAATLLTPLAYIFLRAGPTRHRPWQITDTAAHSRVAWALGRWAADTCALWMLLVGLTVAGLILGIFRLEGQMNIVETTIALWLPAAPALALIAAIRLFLDARNLTRRWFGDVVFFILWIALLIVSIIGTVDPETNYMANNPMTDAFGFTSPIIGAVDYPVDGVTIGGAPNSGETVMVDAYRGVTDAGYMVARLSWLGISALVAVVAGLIWAPMKARSIKVKGNPAAPLSTYKTSIKDVPFKAPKVVSARMSHYIAGVINEIKLLFRSRLSLLILLAVAIAGAFLPFRTVAGPAIFLVLIFPISQASARWQNNTVSTLLNTFGPGRFERAVILFLSSMFVAIVTLTPAMIVAVFSGNSNSLMDAGLIAVSVPLVLVALGALTRSAVTGRLIMLMAWYVYLSSAT
ncbi:hypothetical protein KFE96_01095 [Kordiimonas sp. SCSIO 12603]|uniref:hypothetical protein n=1 Tax=Kordiimonas sp. SCSIO 12603 TaxID=2829596 RepID=UPI0021035D89|nr:hypothetical protein [Kordiimonas sp. SCSIO 12603]UTW58932.1 hypothetical protein KFE96_01095 [Kordiimonas sp. SCSIO 12603]